ncbi:MAG: hypothetical protein P4L53_04360 [Candidatus Obscuribacterales bacterium]|nr:hypothetical protein [Candidatus Obscuribacterales bacterium]
MHFFGLNLLDLGKVVLLLWCALTVVSMTSDRHRILGVTPPPFWFRSLQHRANEAVASFEQVLALAEAEDEHYYSSEKLHSALLHAHMRCVPDGSKLPWFGPRRFVEELECRCNDVVDQLKAAIEYQMSAAFLLEASAQLKLARNGHPERMANDLLQVERNFQLRLNRLQEEKQGALKRTRAHAVVVAQEIDAQLGAVEEKLQQLLAGTTVKNLSV